MSPWVQWSPAQRPALSQAYHYVFRSKWCLPRHLLIVLVYYAYRIPPELLCYAMSISLLVAVVQSSPNDTLNFSGYIPFLELVLSHLFFSQICRLQSIRTKFHKKISTNQTVMNVHVKHHFLLSFKKKIFSSTSLLY